MLYYLLFWTLLGFIIHFYIIFGTNLLTRGPVPVSVIFPILVFRRKGISNGVQTEWNLRERDFGNQHDPGNLEWTSSNQRGGHEAGGAPSPSWAPRGSTDLLHPPIYTAATFGTQEIPSWGIFRSSAGGGIDHGGPLHQLHGPPMMCE